MINKSLIYSIDLYQKYLSPYKGYCCAYKVYHDDVSCSQFTKNSIKELGFCQAMLIIKKRFKDCKISSEKIKEEKKECCESEGFKKFDNGVGCVSNGCNIASCFSIFGH